MRGTGRHGCFRFPRPGSERCPPTPHHTFLTPSSERQVNTEGGPPAASPRPAPAQASASLRGLFSWWLRPRLPRDVSMCRFGRCGLRCGPRACSQRGGRVFAMLPAAFLSGVPPSLSLLPQIAASCERALLLRGPRCAPWRRPAQPPTSQPFLGRAPAPPTCPERVWGILLSNVRLLCVVISRTTN